MKNKKITSLLVAGALTVGIVGGTLAWLTASDSVTNKFDTAKNQNVTVQIWEKFDSVGSKAMQPGKVVDKAVQVKNSADFDQFIRVKLDVTGLTSNVSAQYFDNNISTKDNIKDNTWVLASDGAYYYMGKVGAGKFTNGLLKSVTFSSDAKLEDMNKAFTIPVETLSVQASNDAYASLYDTLDATKDAKIIEKLKGYQNATAVGNDSEITGATDTTATEY